MEGFQKSGKESQLPTVSVSTIKGRASLRRVVLDRYWLCDVEVGGFLPIQVTRAIPKSTFKWHCIGPASQGPTYKNGIHTSYVEPCAHQETSGIWTLSTVGLFGLLIQATRGPCGLSGRVGICSHKDPCKLLSGLGTPVHMVLLVAGIERSRGGV